MENQINIAAHSLAIGLSDESEIPSRYKKNTKQRRISADSTIEKSFQENVQQWRNVIQNILNQQNGEDMAWRFINISPMIGTNVTKLTDCEDFIMFTDYLVLRRDDENCSPDELGRLTMLLGAFQREIERVLS
jgi:hypothetical protein